MKICDNSEPRQLLSDLHLLSLIYCILKIHIYQFFLLVFFILTDATTHIYYFVKTVALQ